MFYSSYPNLKKTIFYWDIHLGFWEIASSEDEDIGILGFNDKGQILGRTSNQIFLWDHGKTINLTDLIKNQFPGNWQLGNALLNNLGHMIFSVYDINLGISRSFLWDGSFKLITLKKWEGTSIIIFLDAFDDNDNMIINGIFISPSKNIFVHFGPHYLIKNYSIRNGLPIDLACLPSKLKKDRQGNLYFSKGIEIKKLLKEEFPYYDISHTTEVWDQNSKGCVVGSIDTLYGRHAFLAIPEIEKD